MNIQHSSESCEYYTPTWIIKKIKQFMSVIDLDPASCEEANKLVQAVTYFTKEDDALSQVWANEPVAVYMNPPSGRIGNKSLPGLFWAKLMALYEKQLLLEAVYLGFSLEQMALTQNYSDKSICDFTVCIPKKRIRFMTPNGLAKHPTHSNVICYIPGLIDQSMLFKSAFEDVGKIMFGY